MTDVYIYVQHIRGNSRRNVTDVTMKNINIATVSIHGDDGLANVPDVAPPIRVTTTYKYSKDPSQLVPCQDLETHVYSRTSQPNVSRVEKVLGDIYDGDAVVYSSGLSAFYAAMVYYNPKVVFVGNGYNGVTDALELFKRKYGTKIYPLNSDPTLLNKGDVIHVETPVNPNCTALDLEYFAKVAHDRGAYLMVDSTFAPLPLQDPFQWGADMVHMSATKYLAGHSDVLAGVLVTKDPQAKRNLVEERQFLGTILPSLESWLLLRSLRTFNMRIRTQTDNANKIVTYLESHKDELSGLKQVLHASLQSDDFARKQLPLGGPPVFSVLCDSIETAKALPSKLRLFEHCTSLGGVESTVEWRRMSDKDSDETLLRVSVGCEDVDDLIANLTAALK